MKCKNPACNREVTHPKLGLCGPCYSGMLYWSKKSRQEQIAKVQQLQILESRMDAMMPANVAVKKFKRVMQPWDLLPGQVNPKKQYVRNVHKDKRKVRGKTVGKHLAA